MSIDSINKIGITIPAIILTLNKLRLSMIIESLSLILNVSTYADK